MSIEYKAKKIYSDRYYELWIIKGSLFERGFNGRWASVHVYPLTHDEEEVLNKELKDSGIKVK